MASNERAASKQSRSVKSKNSRAASSPSTGQTFPATETFGSLPQIALLPMELPLTLSAGGSHARILAQQAANEVSERALEAAFMQKSYDLLATYDRNSSSWRTSQTCLVAQVSNQGDGLAEYWGTWPSAGMMRSGQIFRRPHWALRIAGNVYGLLPTPLKSDMQANFSAGTVRRAMQNGKQEHLCYRPIMMGWGMRQIVTLYERVMGFPKGWLVSMLPETP